jgi:hypothetical protein
MSRDLVPATPMLPDAPASIVEKTQVGGVHWQRGQLQQAAKRLDAIAMRAGAHQIARMRNLKASDPAEYARRFGDFRSVKPDDLPPFPDVETPEGRVRAIDMADAPGWQDAPRPADADIAPLTKRTIDDVTITARPKVAYIEAYGESPQEARNKLVEALVEQGGRVENGVLTITLRPDWLQYHATWVAN